MSRKIWRSFWAIVAISAAPTGAVILPATPAAAEPVTECLSLQDGQLVNSCGYTIEAVWCTENIDCNNGRYTNTWTIGAYGSYPVRGGNSGNTVHWGACRGSNSISTNDTDAYSWQFTCED